MNSLVQGRLAPANDYQVVNYHSKSQKNSSIESTSAAVDGSSLCQGGISKDFPAVPRTSDDQSEEEICLENDHSNATMTSISEMLMEEEGNLENMPHMLHVSLALQATEKSLYDLLNNHNHSLNENTDCPPNAQSCRSSSDIVGISFLSSDHDQDRYFDSSSLTQTCHFSSYAREKKNRDREEDGEDLVEQQRCNKQLADGNVGVGELEPSEMYDKVLLCCGKADKVEKIHQKKVASSRGRPKKDVKHGNILKQAVDLRTALIDCAQAMATNNIMTVKHLLMLIRRHSSPHGDSTERVTHYFANALEARLAGTGPMSYASFLSKRILPADCLKAYQAYMDASPFRKMSQLLANETIKKLTTGATRIHIIDFGIMYGYQWPCLIQALSERPSGPPKLRITGIDFPRPGFRPAERVEESGYRLKKYCERFRVPFEYNAIAQKWETIKVEDLKIQKEDEILVVNSMFQLNNMPDETLIENSPRDAVLNLIRKINPNLFIHGIVNGTYNTPFFVTRFREALFHFSAMFDIFEAKTPRDDKHRALFEQEIFGKDAMNIIACEGSERVDRPETYKQWRVRNKRAGFRQVSLDQELVKYARYKVKMEYNKDFSVDEDGKWMLQGWKGRVIHALSFWQPKHKLLC